MMQEKKKIDKLPCAVQIRFIVVQASARRGTYKDFWLMPNWVENVIVITGPDAELARLCRECIRVPRDESELTFDFDSLVPQPAAVIATIDDRSEATERTCLEATGHTSWYDWNIQHWGTKWNSAAFSELAREPEFLAFAFDTAWSSPLPVLRALTSRFPSLRAQIVSADPSMDWAIVGELWNGRLSYASMRATRSVVHLMRTAHPRALTFLGGTGRADDPGFDSRGEVEQRIKAAFGAARNVTSPDDLDQLIFAEDILAFEEWVEDECGCDATLSKTDIQEAADAGIFECSMTPTFLARESRCCTPADRDILFAAAQALKAHVTAHAAAQQDSPLLANT